MFRGDVVRPSHEGGLLISFTGSSPALGSTIETESGIRLGKVDTVLGSIHKPWVHVYPISKGLDIVGVLGQCTIISSKKNSQKSKPRREDRRQDFSRNNTRHEKKNYNDNDWICSKCSNDNFSWRERCNKCDAPKGGSRSERPNRWDGRNRSERSGNNMGREKKIFNDNDWICSKCSNDNFSWRVNCNKCDAPKGGSRSERPRGRGGGRSERPRGRDSGRSERPRGRDSGRSERPRGRDSGRSERPREKSEKRQWGRDSGRSERPREKSEKRQWGRDSGRSERPRGRDSGRSERSRGRDSGRSERSRGRDSGRSERSRGRDSGKSEKKDRSPKRLRGKSRSHFKNRELDDIFKKNRE